MMWALGQVVSTLCLGGLETKGAVTQGALGYGISVISRHQGSCELPWLAVLVPVVTHCCQKSNTVCDSMGRGLLEALPLADFNLYS